MLVLSRKVNQQIVIGENITITIVRIAGDKIRLGIDAPSDVRILRSELQKHDSTTPTTSNNDEVKDGQA